MELTNLFRRKIEPKALFISTHAHHTVMLYAEVLPESRELQTVLFLAAVSGTQLLPTCSLYIIFPTLGSIPNPSPILLPRYPCHHYCCAVEPWRACRDLPHPRALRKVRPGSLPRFLGGHQVGGVVEALRYHVIAAAQKMVLMYVTSFAARRYGCTEWRSFACPRCSGIARYRPQQQRVYARVLLSLIRKVSVTTCWSRKESGSP